MWSAERLKASTASKGLNDSSRVFYHLTVIGKFSGGLFMNRMENKA